MERYSTYIKQLAIINMPEVQNLATKAAEDIKKQVSNNNGNKGAPTNSSSSSSSSSLNLSKNQDQDEQEEASLKNQFISDEEDNDNLKGQFENDGNSNEDLNAKISRNRETELQTFTDNLETIDLLSQIQYFR